MKLQRRGFLGALLAGVGLGPTAAKSLAIQAVGEVKPREFKRPDLKAEGIDPEKVRDLQITHDLYSGSTCSMSVPPGYLKLGARVTLNFNGEKLFDGVVQRIDVQRGYAYRPHDKVYLVDWETYIRPPVHVYSGNDLRFPRMTEEIVKEIGNAALQHYGKKKF